MTECYDTIKDFDEIGRQNVMTPQGIVMKYDRML